MKKLLFAFLAGLIPALAITSELKAQTSNEVAYAASIMPYSKMANTGMTDNTNPVELKMVNAKALRNFSKYYKVKAAKWANGIDCTTATFFSDDITNIIFYSKKGNWTGSLKIYQEDKMPKDIRKMIRQEYYDYKIFAVQEVLSPESNLNPTYIVVIVGENDIKWVRIQDDNMDVYNEVKKS